MKVYLAGYNVDAKIIEQLKQRSGWDDNNVTPETLSASYARISRDPRDIDRLRDEACREVDRARKSNESIIFGMGHASVAEHAVFNFDVIGISRLAVEQIQQFRLASFTEKSQRYITLDGDYYVPEEIIGSSIESLYRKTIEFQNNTYFTLFEKLKNHLFKKHAEMVQTKNGERTVEGWAKEDARYIVSLATLTQFGMTVNARTLEYMLRKLRAGRLAEIRDAADKLFSHVRDIAPSIVRFTVPEPYDISRPGEIRNAVDSLLKGKCSSNSQDDKSVILLYYTPDADDILCASIIFHNSQQSFEQSLRIAKNLSYEDKYSLVKSTLLHRNFYDPVDRFFESIDFAFELTISSSNYAQLKRHRMSSQITQEYNIALGITIPESIREIGMDRIFLEAICETELFYNKLKSLFPQSADYILTNSHRKKVYFKLNGRELYHFISLREDEHAQWDIRDTARIIREQVKQVSPLCALMLCGRNNFDEIKRSVFGN